LHLFCHSTFQEMLHEESSNDHINLTSKVLKLRKRTYGLGDILRVQHGPGSVVGIATGCGLGVPGIESRWGEIFHTCPDRPWGPPSLLYNGYLVFPGGKERPRHDADPSPPSSAVGHERVELYLYYPYGPYGLYRASAPVQGCTLPLPYLRAQQLMSYILCISRYSLP